MNREQTFIAWISEYDKLLRHMINGFEASSVIQDELFQEIALNIWRAILFKARIFVEDFCCPYCSYCLNAVIGGGMSEENDQINMAIKNERLQKQSEDKSIDMTKIIIDEKEALDAEENGSEIDETWAELSQDWQAQPTVNTDIGVLIKHTRRKVNHAKLCFGVNVLITVFISIYCLEKRFRRAF